MKCCEKGVKSKTLVMTSEVVQDHNQHQKQQKKLHQRYIHVQAATIMLEAQG